MKHASPGPIATATMAIMLMAAGPARSDVQLRFESDGQHVEVGGTGTLSIMLDDPLDVRTIELQVRFDASVVTGLGGEAGGLFQDSGCALFTDFDDTVPGEWYAGLVTLGPTCYITGPGEIYRWEFQGAADGSCAVIVDSVQLYDHLAQPIAGVSLNPATIYVGSATAVPPTPPRALSFDLNPNPFNPCTVLSCRGRAGEHATLSVYDLSGRLVASPWRGTLGTEPVTVRWDGGDLQGRASPGGVYLFLLSGEHGRPAVGKGVLVR
jgi:hypothetical protein